MTKKKIIYFYKSLEHLYAFTLSLMVYSVFRKSILQSVVVLMHFGANKHKYLLYLAKTQRHDNYTHAI